MRVETTANMGAYSSLFAPFIPTGAALKVLPGVYDVKNLVYRVKGVLTNTTPVDAYRGAGRPEFDLSDGAADRRRGARGRPRPDRVPAQRNFIAAAAMPFKTAAGEIYDSGEFAKVMDAALKAGRLGGLRQRARSEAATPRPDDAASACPTTSN